MSVEATTWVWKHSATRGNNRLVLLAIADWADDDGGNAWPSVRKLAEKCLLSESTVHRIIRELSEAGQLEVERHQGGGVDLGPHHRPNRYRVVMTGGSGGMARDPLEAGTTACQIDTGSQIDTGPRLTPGVTGDTTPVSPLTPPLVSPLTPNPSLSTSVNRQTLSPSAVPADGAPVVGVPSGQEPDAATPVAVAAPSTPRRPRSRRSTRVVAGGGGDAPSPPQGAAPVPASTASADAPPSPPAPARSHRYTPEADALARELWEGLTPRPLCGFVGFRERLSECLGAGYTAEALRRVAGAVAVWSRAGIETAFARSGVNPKAGSTPPRSPAEPAAGSEDGGPAWLPPPEPWPAPAWVFARRIPR